MPMVVDVEAWLGGDIHAAEKGRTITPGRDGTGDQPIAWVDDTTVAVQGIGTSHDRMLDGVELYDVTPRAPDRRRRGRVRGLGPRRRCPDRVREGFRPTAHRGGTFAEPGNDRLRIWVTGLEPGQ
ncbi:MAG: hypothetical protein QOI78_8424 [Actinomycetota bacterium]|jgi:hypothetical protein|nr:hypothetical protein [Actinomycetota bacterium]